MPDTAFSTDQFHAIYPEGVERHYWNIARNAIIARTLSREGARQNILEVGCGKGLVVKHLIDHGFAVKGVELAPVDVLPEVRDHVRVNVDVFSLDQSERAAVRTLLLLDVIEHIEDAPAFLARLRAAFPSLERMVVTVPARQELFSNYDTFNGHFRRYDRALLHAHLGGIAPRSISLSYFFHALYPALRMALLMKLVRHEGFNVPHGPIKRAMHLMLAGMFTTEHALLPSTMAGTSLIAVARM